MPEVGLIPFAKVALEAASAALPRYRSPFSKQQFTQPHSAIEVSGVRLLGPRNVGEPDGHQDKGGEC